MESTGLVWSGLVWSGQVRSGLRFALLFSVLNNAVPGRSQESENGDQDTKFVTRLFPLQHQRYDDAGNDNPRHATPEAQLIRHDINQDKSNGQDPPHRAGTG